ncbi:MAG: hypothetical protein WD066_00075, partial [Planctomycetaceae bacterium]
RLPLPTTSPGGSPPAMRGPVGDSLGASLRYDPSHPPGNFHAPSRIVPRKARRTPRSGEVAVASGVRRTLPPDGTAAGRSDENLNVLKVVLLRRQP